MATPKQQPVAEISANGDLFFNADISDIFNEDDIIQEDENEETVINAKITDIDDSDNEDSEEIEDEDNDEKVKEVEVDTLTEPTSDYSDYSDSALIALSEIREGEWELEEKDIPKDLDPLTLRELYRKANEDRLERIKNDIVAQTGEAQEYVEFLLKGGDPKALQESLKYSDLKKLDPTKEEDQIKLLTAQYKEKQIPVEDIQDLVDGILDKGKGEERARKALEEFNDFQKNYLKNVEENRARQLREQQKQQEEFFNSVSSVITSGEVGGLKLTSKQQKEILDAITKPTEIVELIHPATGQPVKQKVTKAQKLQSEINTPEKMAAFYVWLLNGADFTKAKNQGAVEQDDSLQSLLRSRTTKVVKQSTNRTENAFDRLVSRK